MLVVYWYVFFSGSVHEVDLNVTRIIPVAEVDKANKVLEMLCRCYADLRKNWDQIDILEVQVIIKSNMFRLYTVRPTTLFALIDNIRPFKLRGFYFFSASATRARFN